jgi:hypothetical protein
MTEGKTGPVRDGYSGRGRANRVKEVTMVDILFIHENSTMNHVEMVLRRGMRKNDREVNLIKIHCKHICKCHNEPPHTTNIW